MLKIPLAQGKELIFDASMKQIVESHKWYLHWARWKNKPNYYAKMYLYIPERYESGLRGQVQILAHHVVIGKPLNGMQIDHINGDSLDNRRDNLRIVTSRQNSSNQKCHRNLAEKSSRYVGVCFDKTRSKWLAKIYVNRTQVNLGRFNSQEEAASSYQEKLKELNLNGIK